VTVELIRRPPPFSHLELSGFFDVLPDVEATIHADYLSLRYSHDGTQLVEHTLYLPHETDAERLADRITSALAAERRRARYTVARPRPARRRPRGARRA
jgi:hypothetical protein